MKKRISIDQYNKRMNRLIKKGKSVSETLIDLLEEASKWEVVDEVQKRKI